MLSEYEQSQTSKSKTLKKTVQTVFQQAQNCFQQALQQDPDDIYTWDEYARVCFNLAHLASPKESDALWQTTIHAYRRVLFHRDNRLIGAEALLETTVFLSMAYAKSKQFEQATEWLSLIQAIRPQHELPHYARACLISLQSQSAACDLSEALEHLARALQLASDRGSLAQAARQDADLQALRQALPQEFESVLAGSK